MGQKILIFSHSDSPTHRDPVGVMWGQHSWWKSTGLRAALLTVTWLVSAACWAQQASPDGVPSLPQRGVYPTTSATMEPDGGFSWIGSETMAEKRSRAVYSFWQPATGEMRQEPLPIDGSVYTMIKTSHGTLLLMSEEKAAPTGVAHRLVLVRSKTASVSAPLLVARAAAKMVVMRDQSVVILGGSADNKRTAAVELVRYAAGRLTVERLPDLPGELRQGYSTVALDDGRLMVLGGSSGKFIGCWPCTAETYFLDPLSKAWSAGPRLPEPSADASATRLPDGQVLLAGGWTPESGSRTGPTRATWLFNPSTRVFVPAKPMATGVAMHHAVWAPQGVGANAHAQLLVAGGNSTSIQAFDVATGHWRLVGESCKESGTGSSIAFPFVFNRQSYLWLNSGGKNFCDRSNGSSDWELNALRLEPSSQAPGRVLHWKRGLALYRHELAFAPSNGKGAALAVGGSLQSATSAVDAIWPDGRIMALPSLLHARRAAKVVALPDGGFLVVGGSPDAERNPSDNLPVEWLSSAGVSGGHPWVTLDTKLPNDAVIGYLASGQALVLTSGTQLQTLRFLDTGKGRPTIAFKPLPALPVARRDTENSRVLVKGLTDGRIIAAGGDIDRHHEIYNPSSRTWRRSALSRGSGGPVLILNDGRVVKLSRLPAPASEQKRGTGAAAKEIALLEVSSADGLSWKRFGKTPPLALARFDNARLFSIQDELFLSGREVSNDGFDLVQWFNRKSQRWEIVWEAATGDNGRHHVGRLIARSLANGKQIVLPVAGF